MKTLKFFNPFIDKKIDIYQQRGSKEIKYVKQGYCYWALFFGYFYFLFRGMWLWFFGTWAIAMIIYVLGSPLYYLQGVFFAYLGYIARERYRKHLEAKGYRKIKTIGKMKKKVFKGKVTWVIFWVIFFWPAAIAYYFANRE